MKIVLLISLLFIGSSANDTFYYTESNKKITLTSLSSQNDLNEYEKDDGSIVAINDTFFVTFKDKKDVIKLLSNYNVSISKQYTETMYLVRSNSGNTIKNINQINNEDYVVPALPNVYSTI